MARRATRTAGLQAGNHAPGDPGTARKLTQKFAPGGEFSLLPRGEAGRICREPADLRVEIPQDAVDHSMGGRIHERISRGEVAAKLRSEPGLQDPI
jgi:hypothetical protein